MTRLRFTLAQLMVLVIFLAFGFAALRNANEFWASLSYTLAIISVSAAVVGAIIRGGTARAAWLGFAVFGLAYVILGLSLPLNAPQPIYWDYTNGHRPLPVLLIDWALHRLQPYLFALPRGAGGFIPYDQVSHSIGIILFGLVGAIIGRLIASKRAKPNPGPVDHQ